MRRFVLCITAVLLLSLSPTIAGAAGFLIFEEGAKALAMGGAFTAQADDPSAVFYNPAGLCALEGTQLYLGGTAIVTNTDFAGIDPDPGYGVLEKTKTQLFTPVAMYVTHQINDNVTAGLGVFNLFGLGREWDDPDTFSGRHISYDVDLRTYYFNPTLSWKMNDMFSIGVGAQLVYSDVELKRYQLMWDPDGGGFVNVARIELNGDNTIDAGFNAGILYRHEKVSIGVTYRSSVKVDYEGDGVFTQVPSGNSALDAVVASVLPPNQGMATTIEMPPLVSVGIAFNTIEKVTFEVDLNWVGWSTFDTLPFDFKENDALDTERIQDYDDVFSVRTGAEYSYSDALDLRFGYYYDPSPQPEKSMSPLLPDTDRHGLTLGFGYHTGPWTVDAFDLIMIFLERDTEGQSLDGYNGTYSSWANLFGVNIGYAF